MEMKGQMIWWNLLIFAIFGYIYFIFSHIFLVYYIFNITLAVTSYLFASFDVKISIISQTDSSLQEHFVLGIFQGI